MPKLPLDVECPRCGAGVGFSCRTAGGYRSITHMARWAKIGIAEPDIDDLLRDRNDQRKRELETIRRLRKNGYRENDNEN